MKKVKKVFSIIATAVMLAMVSVATGCMLKEKVEKTQCTHQFDGGKVTKASTCVDEGETTYTCLDCGHTVTEKRPLLEHTYNDGETTKAATCTGLGEVTYRCVNCGTEKTEELPIVEHSIEVIPLVAPTCETEGYTEGARCEICREVLIPQVAIPALGHTAVADLAIAETCTTSGKTAGSHCGLCGEILEAQTTIPATGHTPVTEGGKSPTCTTSGMTGRSMCSTCGDVFQEPKELPPTGHTDMDVNYCCDVCGSVSDFEKFYSISDNYTEVDVAAAEMVAGGVYRIYKTGANMDGDESNGNECWYVDDTTHCSFAFIAPSYEGITFGMGDAEWAESTPLYFCAGEEDGIGIVHVDIKTYVETVGVKYNRVITEDNQTCYVDIYFEPGSTITIANEDGSKVYTLSVDELIWSKTSGLKRLIAKTN